VVTKGGSKNRPNELPGHEKIPNGKIDFGGTSPTSEVDAPAATRKLTDEKKQVTYGQWEEKEHPLWDGERIIAPVSLLCDSEKGGGKGGEKTDL